MDLSIISRLVKENTRLILPDLGAFLVKDLSDGFKLENVSFTPFLRYDDPKLEIAISEHEGISRSEAHAKVQELVSQIKRTLDSGISCVFPTLGRLEKDASGVVIFVREGEQQPEVSATPAIEPLTPVKDEMKPQGAQQKAEGSNAPGLSSSQQQKDVSGKAQANAAADKAQSAQKPLKRPPQRKYVQRAKPPKVSKPSRDGGKSSHTLRNVLLVVLALVLLLGGLDYFIFQRVLSPTRVSGWFGGDGSNAVAVSTPVDAVDSAVSDYPVDSTLLGEASDTSESPVSSERSELEKEFERRSTGTSSQGSGSSSLAAATPSSSPTRASQHEVGYASGGSNQYHIVLGSFQNPDYAESYAAKLRNEGLDSRIMERTSGYHAVIVGSYATWGEASSALVGIQENYSEAWIVRQ